MAETKREILITKSLTGAIVAITSVGGTSETLRAGVHSFSFLIERNETVTSQELAERIKAAYSLENPKTAAVVAELTDGQNSG